MLAGCYCGCYLICGMVQVRMLLPRHRPLNRVWLGLCLGLLEMMWFPALFAFLMRFGMAAHLCALAGLAAATAATWLLRDKRSVCPWDAEETQQLKQALLVFPNPQLKSWQPVVLL